MATRKRTKNAVRTIDRAIMPIVALRIRKAREALSMDVEMLAALSRTKYQTLWSYEQGASIPNVFTAIRIANILKQDVVKLFTEPASDEELRHAAGGKDSVDLGDEWESEAAPAKPVKPKRSRKRK
jgi:ribosome-binding protein aMBF1 (putative translation factor)